MPSPTSPGRPYVIAVIGAGPSGIYAAEALAQQHEVPVEVAVIDRLPVPFGLVRYGVAPDHPSIRSIRHTLERTLDNTGVRFFGDVTVGTDLTVAELRDRTDAVIYAFGASSDRRLGIPGEEVPGSIAAPDFVAWYCGHPDVHPDVDRPADFSRAHPSQAEVSALISDTTTAVVVGAGNVALDVVRVLVKHAHELAETDMADDVLEALAGKAITDVHLLARRGPAYTTFTTKELRELGAIEDLDILLDETDLELDESSASVVGQNKVAARNLEVLRGYAARPRGQAGRRLHLHFWTRPVRLEGGERVTAIETERTELTPDGGTRGTGVTSTLAAQLVVRSIGYRGLELPGAPYDAGTGRVPHAEGRVIRDGGFSPDEYATGWIKRGPTGVIGTNKSDAVETVASLLADITDGAITASHDITELEDLLADRGITPLGMPAWHRIDAAEIELGTAHGRPRTTLSHRADLLAAGHPDAGP